MSASAIDAISPRRSSESLQWAVLPSQVCSESQYAANDLMAEGSPHRKCQSLAARARSAKNVATAPLTMLLRGDESGHQCNVQQF